jgi:hypothetical protein
MIINSHTNKAEIAQFFGVSFVEADYLKTILIDECRTDTARISIDDMDEIIETAIRFAEEND